MQYPECKNEKRDPLTPEQCHKNMFSIRSKDTSIEVKLRKALWHHGYRYRKNYSVLPGKPDIAITKHRIDLISVYGDKLGVEAYKAVDKAPNGASFRKNGGPLIQVVDKEKAEWIRAKETAIGMMA